ncbi:hypothetical protein THTE_0999 [Thermogutta terrifontis]|uniref:Uncharacterized protein n=1 Tax=Thermogutta terrifontis TaxID=1331910 RepID=A0A286RCB0_9BACT|nr:hypothetical protein THTE_0999 [Thermogutta terrifontis]
MFRGLRQPSVQFVKVHFGTLGLSRLAGIRPATFGGCGVWGVLVINPVFRRTDDTDTDKTL